jgi:hypothetical protein
MTVFAFAFVDADELELTALGDDRHVGRAGSVDVVERRREGVKRHRAGPTGGVVAPAFESSLSLAGHAHRRDDFVDARDVVHQQTVAEDVPGDHAVRALHRAEDPAGERFVIGSPVPRGFREVGALETRAAEEVVAPVDDDELERARGSIPGPGDGTSGCSGYRYDVGALLEGSRRAQALTLRRPLVVVHNASPVAVGRFAFPGVHVGLRQLTQGYGAARGFRDGCLEERRDGPLRHGGSPRGWVWRGARGMGGETARFKILGGSPAELGSIHARAGERHTCISVDHSRTTPRDPTRRRVFDPFSP